MNLKNKNILLILIIFVIVLLFFIFQQPSNINTIISNNKSIDSIKNVNNSLVKILNKEAELRKKDLIRINKLEEEKQLLFKSLNKKIKELNTISKNVNKIPKDSVFIVLKQKYYEDSIRNTIINK